MYCSNCGKQINDNGAFCPYCGAAHTPVISNQKTAPAGSRKKHKALPFIIIAAVLLVAAIIAVLLFMLPMLNSKKNGGNSPSIKEQLAYDRIREYEEAIARNPYDEELYEECAEEYIELKEYDKARELLETALQVLPAVYCDDIVEQLNELDILEGYSSAPPQSTAAAATQPPQSLPPQSLPPQSLPPQTEVPFNPDDYYAYIADELLPGYGLANMDAIKWLRDSVPDYNYGDTLELPIPGPECEGLLSAAIHDLDGDGIQELVCLLSEDEGNGETKLIRLLIFTFRNGSIVRVSGCEDSILGVIDGDQVREFSARLTDKGLLVYYFSGHPDGAIFSEYSYYTIENERVVMSADVFCMDGFWGEKVVYLYSIPAWLPELASLPICTEPLEPSMGIYDKPYDVDECRVLFVDIDDSYREDWANNYPELAETSSVYSSVDTAIGAVIDSSSGQYLMSNMTEDDSMLHDYFADYIVPFTEPYLTSGIYNIRCAGSERVINLAGKTDEAADKNGINVIIHDATGSNMQRFRVSRENGNACRLFAMSSSSGYGRVLDVYRGKSSTIEAGMNIDLWSVSRDTDQQWLIEVQEDGLCVIRLASNPSLVMTCEDPKDNGSNVYLSQYNGSYNQLWCFIED